MPAKSLKGLTLEGGWLVKEMLYNPKGTGGFFSIGYIVEKKDGTQAFLKALDYSSAHQSDDPALKLQELTTLFNFERAVLNKCKDKKLSRVVVPISEGQIDTGIGTTLNKVQYIIFQKAIGDLRSAEIEYHRINAAWCLRKMHESAVGLKQLHSCGIVHQDLKPSNVLVFDSLKSKLSDLGTSCDKELTSPRDIFAVAGDMSYAPFDLLYKKEAPETFSDRMSLDIYLLGSLFFFFFCDVSLSQAIKTKLMNSGIKLSNGSFISNLPYIKTAFEEVVGDLKKIIDIKAPNVSDKIIDLVLQLCEPDPKERGVRIKNNISSNPYDMHRIISKLDLIATKAEYNLK